MTLDERREFKKALEKEKARLERGLAGIANPDLKDTKRLNWDPTFPQMTDEDDRGSSATESSADEVEEYETRLETGGALESRLRDVSRALEKIDTDEYGRCERCGAPIQIERLRANPAARYHTEHAE